MNRFLAPALSLVALSSYWLCVAMMDSSTFKQRSNTAQVSFASPIQVLLFGGDRFLAANVESTRALASATEQAAREYRLRAHNTVSRLNPCHEDNYWIGNASLSWGGAEKQGFELLQNAMHCRYWDEWPAFFYGFNKSFFSKDIDEARVALETAAARSAKNAAVYRNFSIMLAAGKINDTRMALNMLEKERDSATDPKLKEMLGKRVIRLQGLLTLRDAQTEYESRYGKPLEQPQQLLDSHIIEAFPDDPLRIGYEFRDNSFHLRKMQMQY